MADPVQEALWRKVDQHTEKISEHETRIAIQENQAETTAMRFNNIDTSISVNAEKVMGSLSGIDDHIKILTDERQQRVGAKKLVLLWVFPALALAIAAGAFTIFN